MDEEGNVANFVETEQIIDVYDGHTLAFVIVRGSVSGGSRLKKRCRKKKIFLEKGSIFF